MRTPGACSTHIFPRRSGQTHMYQEWPAGLGDCWMGEGSHKGYGNPPPQVLPQMIPDTEQSSAWSACSSHRRTNHRIMSQNYGQQRRTEVPGRKKRQRVREGRCGQASGPGETTCPRQRQSSQQVAWILLSVPVFICCLPPRDTNVPMPDEDLDLT